MDDPDWMQRAYSIHENIEELVIKGLTVDGAHHKQYYLELLASVLGVDLSNIEYDEGIPN